jgi:hypothetical protein
MSAWEPAGTEAAAVLPALLGAVQTVQVARYASAGYATDAADDPAHTVWQPRILGDIEISQTAFDALGIGGRQGLTLSDATLADADGHFADMVRLGIADGRRALLRTVPVLTPRALNFGVPFGSATRAFTGIVRRIEHTAAQQVRVSLTDIAERLATPLQSAKFAGTGGLEGPPTMAGRVKPVLVGQCFNLAPIAVGNVDLGDGPLPTWVVHSGAADDIRAVRIRGVEQSLVGTAPGVGEARIWLSVGAFQLGATPDGVVTCDADGDNSLSGYASTTAGVIRRLIQGFGPLFTDAEIDTESFGFADTDMPGVMGWYSGGRDLSAAQAIEEILAHNGACLCGGRGGVVRVFDPLGGNTAQFGLGPANIIAIEPIELPAALRPLPRQVQVEWGRNWSPLTDTAGSVDPDVATTLAAPFHGSSAASDDGITLRVLQQRDMRFAGLYAADDGEADALARAEQWRDFLAAGPRGWRVTTDRYLGQIECGDVGVLDYPAFGLDRGVSVVVVGWRETLSARRLALDLITRPALQPEPDGTGAWDVDFVWNVTRLA